MKTSLYTILEKDEDRILFAEIAKLLGLKVSHFTEYYPIDFRHIEKHKTHYYMELNLTGKWAWDISDIYHIIQKPISNEKFLVEMYRYSLSKKLINQN
jgi:cell fate regulator YaaT (PSP1 superfamily)